MNYRPQAGKRRFRFLIGALLACAAALPITRLTVFRKPAPPPASAAAEVQHRYWQQRVQSDISDVAAYVRLGLLEEKAGYYMSAVKYLRAARALGAPDTTISGPLGRVLTQLARDDEALPELEKAVRLAPNSVEAVVNLAGLYINQGEPQMGAAILKKFVGSNAPSLGQRDAEETQRLALAFLECGDNRSARRMAENSIKTQPGNMVLRSVAARGALAEKDFPAARRHLEAMLAQAAGDSAVLYLYGIVLEAQGAHEMARQQWEKAISENPAALDIFERIGDSFARQKNMRQAAAAFEVVAQRDHSRDAAVRVATAFTRIEKPTAAEQAKKAYWEAVAAGFLGEFEFALERGRVAAANPVTKRAGLLAIAEAYRGMQQTKPYLAAMQKVTADGTLDDLLLMADAYDKADEHVKHADYLQRALAKAPPERQPMIHLSMAQAYRNRGMRDEAERELEQALQKNPNDADAYRQLADVYFERRTVGGRLEKAIRAREAAVALDPGQESDWQNLGRAYMALGDAGRAIRFFEHAIDLEPGYGAPYLELGRAYARIGDKNSSKYALSLYSRFVAFDQQRQTLKSRAGRNRASADDLIAYGDFLRKTGYTRDAVSQYERALPLRPKDKNLRAKLDALYSRLRMTASQSQAADLPQQTGGGGG